METNQELNPNTEPVMNTETPNETAPNETVVPAEEKKHVKAADAAAVVSPVIKTKAKIRYKKLSVMLIDILCGIIAFVLAWILEYKVLNGIRAREILIYGAISVIIPIIIFVILRGYQVVWRFAGPIEIIRMAITYVATFFVLLAIQIFYYVANSKISVALIFIYCTMSLILVMIARYAPKLYTIFRYRLSKENRKPLTNVIVYGAGFTGAALIKRFMDNPKDGYNPVAIIDDNMEKRGNMIAGIRVVGGRESIEEVIRKYDAKVVAIAITEISRDAIRQMYNYLMQFDVKVEVVNNITNAERALDSETITLRNLNIEDLLRRKSHRMDRELIDGLIKDKVVMVTGGAGSIGSEICRQALSFGCRKLIIYDHNENGMFELNEEFKKKFETDRYKLVMGTVRDKQKLANIMDKFHPEVVLHAAAYKHVPMMELNPEEAVKNNIYGTRNVIEQCEKSGVKRFVLISTDKAVNPANIMGATKRMAELILEDKSKTSNTVMAAVRFGNVLGSSGSVIPTFIKQINAGGPVTVTSFQMRRYFMTIPEAVTLVLQAGALALGGEVFVLDMGEPVYISQMAEDLIRLSGQVPNVDIPIVEIGLRPGEKLFEELSFSDENVDKTRHEGIFVCKLGDVDHQELEDVLFDLSDAANQSDLRRVEDDIFKMVPSIYRKHSENV